MSRKLLVYREGRRFGFGSDWLRMIVAVAFGALVLHSQERTAPPASVTRAAAALRIAEDLGIRHGANPGDLYELFPDVFPGGYDGKADRAYPDKEATLENIVVALVRWAGWDTVHYSESLASQVKPYVTAEGFPFYGPEPTPRSIPYVVGALVS